MLAFQVHKYLHDVGSELRVEVSVCGSGTDLSSATTSPIRARFSEGCSSGSFSLPRFTGGESGSPEATGPRCSVLSSGRENTYELLCWSDVSRTAAFLLGWRG